MNTLLLPPRKFKHGLVFGKFMPLHEGHRHLLRFASASCERLTILVCSRVQDPIPGYLRYDWVKESFPEATVIHHEAIVPEEPKDHGQFWDIWKETVQRHVANTELDALFTSEDYGWRTAEELGLVHIPVNRVRDLVPISGTAIRKNPLQYWEYIPEMVRPFFVKRVRIIGPESTGKSTLTKALAQEFHTVHVDEYARRLLDESIAHRSYKPGDVRYEDIVTIARGQLATEDAMAHLANRVLFCDTDARTTLYWSTYLFGQCPGWIAREANERHYDLTLLLAPNMPWTQDGQRTMVDIAERERFFAWWEAQLKERQESYVVIREETWEARVEVAIQAVQVLGVVRPASALSSLSPICVP